MARLVFCKSTPEGLSVDVESLDGTQVLLLTKRNPNRTLRWAQIMGIAGREVDSPSEAWYYEFEPLPRNVSTRRVSQKLEGLGYTLGTFDRDGNFRPTADLASSA
jgi:hypothetical protein